jgi:hypothetical protein
MICFIFSFFLQTWGMLELELNDIAYFANALYQIIPLLWKVYITMLYLPWEVCLLDSLVLARFLPWVILWF